VVDENEVDEVDVLGMACLCRCMCNDVHHHHQHLDCLPQPSRYHIRIHFSKRNERAFPQRPVRSEESLFLGWSGARFHVRLRSWAS